MRILHVITDLDTGGAEMMLLRLLRVTRRKWEQMVVSVQDEGNIGHLFSELGVPVHYLGVRRRLPNPTRALSVRKLARGFAPDLIQGWMYHGNLTALLAAKADRGKTPVLWNVRQSLYDIRDERPMTRSAIRLGARLSPKTAAIIYNSHIGAQHHEAIGYCADRSTVIPNGFDSDTLHPDHAARLSFRAELGINNDTPVVGLVARYHPMKDHATFLRAAALVSREFPSVRFVLAGLDVSMQNPALASMVAGHQLQDRVSLLGKRNDIPRLTAALDIACSSSWTEGFPNTLGEAMACGVPCVGTNVGETSHLIGDTGICVPSRDSSALARAISDLIGMSESKLRELGTAARRRIEDHFSIEAVARRYEELYRKHLTIQS